MSTVRDFLSKIRALFSIFQTGREASPLPLVALLVSVAEYAPVSLNIPKYP